MTSCYCDNQWAPTYGAKFGRLLMERSCTCSVCCKDSVKTAASLRPKKPKNTSLIMKLCHFHIHLRVTALSACLEALLGFSLWGSFCLPPLAPLLPWCWHQEQTSKKTPTLGNNLRCLTSVCFLVIILMKSLKLRGLLTGGWWIHFFIISEYPRWASGSWIFHFCFLFYLQSGRYSLLLISQAASSDFNWLLPGFHLTKSYYCVAGDGLVVVLQVDCDSLLIQKLNWLKGWSEGNRTFIHFTWWNYPLL